MLECGEGPYWDSWHGVPPSLSVVVREVRDGKFCLASGEPATDGRGCDICMAGRVFEGSPSAGLMVNLASAGDFARESSSAAPVLIGDGRGGGFTSKTSCGRVRPGAGVNSFGSAVEEGSWKPFTLGRSIRASLSIASGGSIKSKSVPSISSAFSVSSLLPARPSSSSSSLGSTEESVVAMGGGVSTTSNDGFMGTRPGL